MLTIPSFHAGIASSAPLEETTVDLWNRNYDVLAQGYFLTSRSAWPLMKRMKEQGGASVVFIGSKNGVAAATNASAYASAKAAANHLVRGLAVELSPLVRVNGLAPATVVAGSTMFPRDRVIASLVKYNITFEEDDTTENLRNKLANFYAQRTLTKTPITPEDQAEAAYYLISERAAKTTGQVISVDGGWTIR